MGDDDFLGLNDGSRGLTIIRGKRGITRDRYGVIKFPKSMCALCNNTRSQRFDRAYDTYSEYLATHEIRFKTGVPFKHIYGSSWQQSTLDLARYYAKHFGCRMVNARLPVPPSLRQFLDGATDMPDALMILVTTDSVHEARSGLSISPDFVSVSKDRSRFIGFVFVAYVGSVGVRYQWMESRIPDKPSSQFFHFPHPVLNRFVDETAVAQGETRRRVSPRWLWHLFDRRRASEP